MIGGNTLTTIAYSSLGENARAASMFAPEALADTVAPISYGRRTTEMMALNLAGKGGKPWVSRLPFETTIGPFAKAIGLGLSISERAIVDLEFTVGEMSYCAAY